jgi:hypothetical protein
MEEFEEERVSKWAPLLIYWLPVAESGMQT